MSAHTPGPWRKYEGETHLVIAANGEIVIGYNTGIAGYEKGGWIIKEEDLPLIVAAPEVFGLLKDLTEIKAIANGYAYSEPQIKALKLIQKIEEGK